MLEVGNPKPCTGQGSIVLIFSFQDDIHDSVNLAHEIFSIQLNELVISYNKCILHFLMLYPSLYSHIN